MLQCLASSRLDRRTPGPAQAWIATIADKLEVTLEGYKAPQGGVGFGGGGGGGKGGSGKSEA
jgi:hypothetical protein